MRRMLDIHHATLADTPTIVEFQLAMALESEGFVLDRDTLTAGVAAVFDGRADAAYWVAEEDGSIKGMLMTVPSSATSPQASGTPLPGYWEYTTSALGIRDTETKCVRPSEITRFFSGLSTRRWSSASTPDRASKISPLTASTACWTPLPR